MNNRELIRGLVVLLVLQFVLCVALFGDFMAGDKVFAYYDIGNDTINGCVPSVVHLANYLRTDGWPGWSFSLGLGHSLLLGADPFNMLNAAFGADLVLQLRIWIYVLKLVLAGVFFYLFLVAAGIRAKLAVSVAMAYTFSGYAVIDGQWDGFATGLFVYALALWAIAGYMRDAASVRLPLVAAVALYVTMVYFDLGLFVLMVFAATLFCARDRQVVWRQWARGIWPLLAIGALMAAPRLIPVTVQVLDSPRVSIGTSMLGHVARINDLHTIMTELAGLFHKDILDIGNFHHGWLNYLESPGFFVGVLPLLLIAQLWRGDRYHRRILVSGVAVVVAYFIFPGLRSAAFGLQLDYFRISTLWISILLLVMYAIALNRVQENGVDRRLLIGSALVLVFVLAALWLYFGAQLKLAHVWKIAGMGAIALLVMSAPRLVASGWMPVAVAGFVAVEALLVAYPSFHQQRGIVRAAAVGYRDETIGALAIIRARDPGCYRIEKTFTSVSLNDAMAQGYLGVKSYTQQGSGAVRFFSDLGLLKPIPGIVNYSNWLRGCDDRFALYSFLGVRYVLSRVQIDWPGFARVASSSGLGIYRNEFALPLGVVYDHQLLRKRFLGLAEIVKDTALMNAAIVDELVPGLPQFDPSAMELPSPDWLQAHYAGPARVLQNRGLLIDRFGNKRIEARIHSDSGGILAFAIPFAPGWTIKVDGHRSPIFRANLGMMAIQLPAGTHSIELMHAPPGLAIGLALAALGVVLWASVWWQRIRSPRH